ncbi:MAG: gamma-glutamyl-gamma-aminobutyrate hydrolase family protein [Pseudomonadota bacterium]
MIQDNLTPIIGLPACVRTLDDMPYHILGDKYARAVAVSAKCLPVMLPSLGNLIDFEETIGRLDGLLVTGSPSNVHPELYRTPVSKAAEPFDEERDATSLPLLAEAIRQGIPMLAICRGFQELNVLLGGTLTPEVHELPDRMDHRRPQDPSLDVQYGPRHTVKFTPGGKFARLAGCESLEVNTLHWQAIDKLANRLTAEGTAPDGTIEAVSVKGAKGFALGVQWHPEYKSWENDFSKRLFSTFGAAARARMRARASGELKVTPGRVPASRAG